MSSVMTSFLSVNDHGSDFFRIQQEDLSPYLRLGRILHFVTHFKVLILIHSDISMSLFAAERRRDKDT